MVVRNLPIFLPKAAILKEKKALFSLKTGFKENHKLTIDYSSSTFFRLLKTTLQIQESKSVDYAGFIKKFSLTCMKACFVLSLRNRIRQKVRGWAKSTWVDIRRALAIELGLDWLQSTLNWRAFCIEDQGQTTLFHGVTRIIISPT